MIRIPLTLLPWAIIDCIKLIVSINRIQAFLNAEELNDECIGNDLRNPKENIIEMKSACLSWNTGKRRESDSNAEGICGLFILFFLNLHVCNTNN